MNKQLTKEQIIEINKEIQVVLSKYGATLQPTMGISIVALPKETEIISPIQQNEINPTA